MDLRGKCSFARIEGLLVLGANLGCSKTPGSVLLYLAATNQVVSAALVAQREMDEAESVKGLEESENGLGQR